MTTTTLIPTTTTTANTTTANSPTAADSPTAAESFVAPTTIAKGWHADPMEIHNLRWHDGTEWTAHVTHFGPVPCQHCGR